MKSILAVAALFTASAIAQQPLGFKGVQIGATKAQLLERFPALECRPSIPQYESSDEACSVNKMCGMGNLMLLLKDAAPKGLPPSDADCAEAQKAISTFGGEAASGVKFELVSGRFEGFTVNVRWTSFNSIRDALVETYGPGLDATQELQSARGMPFPSRIWKGTPSGGSVVLFERAGGDYGLVTATSPTLAAANRKGATSKSGAKDL